MSHAGGELAEQAGRLAAQAEKVALCLDFDGTLSPIVPDPEAARPLEGMVELLGQLAARYAAVALISGRPADYLAPRQRSCGAVSGPVRPPGDPRRPGPGRPWGYHLRPSGRWGGCWAAATDGCC